ncbi:MAG: hypothetical protein CMP49_02445 [Flavobacteriales bacterium]|jgi:hypothetical protein|nr:hypothetical protein [Flavobacteriales bacterium]|tara:strand:- start:4718 stop:5248 length:531 start_codon:yes stop_codon:yes gene_type:complete
MTNQEFNLLIKGPKENLNNIDLKQIENLKSQFPYCENIHNLSLLKANALDDIKFNKILTITSLYSSNRKNLFHLINPPIKLNTKLEKNKETQLFEEWLSKPAKFQQKNITSNMIKKDITKSTKDNDYLTTETLAEIYIEQGHFRRAIQAYEILCLKYPKKSSFFANQIKKIKNKIK